MAGDCGVFRFLRRSVDGKQLGKRGFQISLAWCVQELRSGGGVGSSLFYVETRVVETRETIFTCTVLMKRSSP